MDKSKKLTMTLDRDTRAALREWAHKDDRSLCSLMRLITAKALAEHRQQEHAA
jgi:hypothetical protein